MIVFFQLDLRIIVGTKESPLLFLGEFVCNVLFLFTTSLHNKTSKISSLISTSVTSKKSPNVYKSCTKVILLEKLKILTPLQKLPKNVGDLGKLIVAKGFEKLPKVQ